MASSIPNQERYVDPFASYNSNVVNTLTEVVTNGRNGLVTPNSCQVEQVDSTSVVVLTGSLIKDDVLIKITANHTLNINDLDQYITTGPYPVPGYNYVVLDYSYIKSKPPPEASIKILRPSERNLLTIVDSYFLLKVIEISMVGPHTISRLLDTDPDLVQNQRQTIWTYASAQGSINIHGANDRGRIVYETGKDKFYFGYYSEWGELTAGGVSVDVNTDTTGVAFGTLCYIDSNRNAVPAIANSFNTQADLIPTVIASMVDGGKGIICGFTSGIQVENGTLIATGDLVYLSEIEAGKVTNIRPTPFFQLVGRAVSSGSITTPIDMIFYPKIMLTTNLEDHFDLVDWNGPLPGGYYAIIDVRGLDGTAAYLIQLYDSATHEQITPSKIEITNGGDYIRVWQPAPQALDYLVSGAGSGGGAGGGGGGGGGGVVTDHSLLTNLSYGASGHVGFAPSPHNNAHHSQTYIVAADVNFTNLNSNGSVGPGGTQVAVGTHTHPQRIDVPTGAILLFASNTAISGYTLITDINDTIVYITPGSGAGGEVGGSYKAGGTWTQPLHNHSIAQHQHDMQSHIHGFLLPEHLHQWIVIGGGGTYGSVGYTYAADGATLINVAAGRQASNWGLIVGGTQYNGEQNNQNFYTSLSPSIGGNTGGPNTNVTGQGGPSTSGDANTANTWRPVGLNMTLQRRN